jgi:hypothetical protein
MRKSERNKTPSGSELIAGIPQARAGVSVPQTIVSHAGQSKEWWSDLRIKLGLGVIITGSKAAIDRLAREMLANGWIEPAGSYGRLPIDRRRT